MVDCVFCCMEFPDVEYLDIYGVCHADPCQRKKNTAILKGEWFNSDEDKKEFEERHDIETYTSALTSLIMLELEDDPEFSAAMRGCVATSSKHYVIKLIIEAYKKIMKGET